MDNTSMVVWHLPILFCFNIPPSGLSVTKASCRQIYARRLPSMNRTPGRIGNFLLARTLCIVTLRQCTVFSMENGAPYMFNKLKQNSWAGTSRKSKQNLYMEVGKISVSSRSQSGIRPDRYKHVDIQAHDISWTEGASGNLACGWNVSLNAECEQENAG